MYKKIFISLSLIVFFINSLPSYAGELLIYKELKLINKNGKTHKKIENNKNSITKKDLSISEQSLKNINDYKNNILKNNNKTINVVFSNNVSKEIVEEELSLILDGLLFFQKYYYTNKLNGVVFTSKDIEWADNFIKDNIHSGWYGNIKKSYKVNEVCSFAFAMEDYGYALCIDNKERNIFNKQTSIHEIFHIVQAQNSNIKNSNNFNMPCWLLEGSATYLGSAIGINDLYYMNTFINNLKYQFNDGVENDLVLKLKSDKAKDIMKNLENTNECKLNWAPYTMGYLATEILISKYGFEKFMIFIQSFSNNVYWKNDFESIFNLNVDIFYDQVILHAKNNLT